MYKIPESVLVVIHSAQREVLLIRRSDAAPDVFWQSVTGSRDRWDEPLAETAAREVWEETGIDCRPASALAPQLRDWGLCNIYPIYPRWLHRYAAGVTHNTEHLFGLQVPRAVPITLNPCEHESFQWLPYREAALCCYPPSNAEAILQLSHARFAPELP